MTVAAMIAVIEFALKLEAYAVQAAIEIRPLSEA